MNKNKLKKKFIIGSANFTQKYGIISNKVSDKEIKKILNLAKKKDINTIDTAESYLKNSNILKNIDNNFKFTTKIKANTNWASFEFCQKKIEDHFKNLNTNKIEIVFFHDVGILLRKNGDKIFQNLELLKKKNFFKKIGLSIYDTNILDDLLKKYNFDVVQCPFNILDRRILNSGYFDKLKKLGKETHIRSIFLQGLLINKSFHKKKYFRKWNFFFNKWFDYMEKNNISPIDYCLSDLMKYDFDRILIGINNSENLKEILNFKTVNKNKMINFEISDRKLIDPRKWR